jgi:hypothetical protein
MTDLTLPGDTLPAVLCPLCGFRCSAGGQFKPGPCPTVGCSGRLDLDLAACALLLVRTFWPDVEWSWQNALYLVGRLPNNQIRRDFDLTSFLHVREAEDIAIERGMERLYGRFLHERLDQSPHGDAGVTWARAPLDVRIRALARALMAKLTEPAREFVPHRSEEPT